MGTPAKQTRPAGALTVLRHYYPLVFVLFVCVALSAGSFFVFMRWEAESLVRDFDAAVNDRAGEIRKRTDYLLDGLSFADSLYAARCSLQKRDLEAFARDPQSLRPEIRVVAFVPRVTNARRAEFEAAARREGDAGFQIMEEDAGARIMAPIKEEYYPALYVAPADKNRGVLGLDFASDPTYWETMEQARDTGTVAATGGLMMTQVGDASYGVMVFVPIYSCGLPHDTYAERSENLVGFMAEFMALGQAVELAVG